MARFVSYQRPELCVCVCVVNQRDTGRERYKGVEFDVRPDRVNVVADQLHGGEILMLRVNRTTLD
jgi:hypothetical protein